MEAGALISELKRRRVIRALVGYGIVAFAVLQIIEPVMHGLHWPDEVLSYVVVALAVGFPIVVSLAWIFDVNAGHIERTGPAQGITGTRLVLVLIAIGFIAAAPGMVWYFAVRGIGRRPSATSTQQQPPQPSIAVLPFADMSPEKNQEYFSDGIAEEILDDLAHVDGLRVVGRTSSFSFKGKADDLRSIGEKLGVAHVLEGSVRKAGDRLKVTAQLISAADGSHVWSETFDRRLTDVFAVQEEIARSVATALKVTLLHGGELPQTRVHTVNLEAYEQYLLGSHLVASYAVDDVRRAVVAFEKAVALDPNLAEAWARLSFALWWNPEKEGDQGRAVETARRALVLAPNLADGYAALATTLDDFEWDFAGADKADARALALAPNSTLALIAHCMNRMKRGRFDEAAAACQRAIDLDPLTVGARNNLTGSYLDSGDLAKARALNNRVLELSPASATGLRNRCALDMLERDFTAARDHCPKITGEEDRLVYTVMMLHESGATADAAQAVNTFITKFGNENPTLTASLFAWQGKADPAFEWLDKAYAAHDSLLSDVKVFWPFSKIRADPRFPALLKKMNLPVD